MAEIFDLLARVSWDTNGAEIDKLNQQLKQQDKTLEELRMKGRRLEDQLVKTNDPKKQAALTAELKKTAQAADAIVKGQQKQADLQKQLTQRAKELGTELRKANDPKQVQGLLRELHKVEKQLDAMGNKATIAGSKMSGIMDKVGGLGQSVMAGFGLGLGTFGVEALIGQLTQLGSAAVQEFEAAERTTRLLQGTLQNLGQEQYFDGLMREANQLAQTFGYLDNDDIVDAQQKLLTYGKLTRQEISSLLPIIIDFAARTGKDIPSATELVIGALEGQGRQLKQYGINLKDAETFTERLALVQGTLGEKVKGAAQDFMQSSEGIKAAAEQQKANILEEYGEAASKIEMFWKTAVAGLYTFIRDMARSADDARNEALKGIADDAQEYAEGLTKEELAIQQRQSKVREMEIKASLKRIADMRAMDGKKMSSEERFQLQERIKNEEELVAKATAKNLAVAKASREFDAKEKARQEEEARVKAERESADKEAKAAAAKTKTIAQAAKKEAAKKENTIKLNIQMEGQLLDRMSTSGISAPRAVASEGIVGSTALADRMLQMKVAMDNIKLLEQEADKRRKDQRRGDREELYNNVLNAASTAQQIISIEQEKTDRLIELQQQRVDAAKDNSKVSLKIEEDRLNALLERRQKYERAQRAIDAAVIVANQAVAISGAIRAITDAGGNPVLIAANAIAIAASIAAAIAAVRSGFGDVGFKEGGYTGDGDPNQESTAVGRRPYKYHKGEFVMDADLTADHRDLFEGIHKRRLKVRQLDDGQYYIAPDVDKLSADYQTAKYSTQDGQVLAELSAMRRLMQQREVSVTNNFDADGFGQAVASQMGQIHLKNLRRN
jgi:hypothetical protein